MMGMSIPARIMRFRPCIDLHGGVVKQVGCAGCFCRRPHVCGGAPGGEARHAAVRCAKPQSPRVPARGCQPAQARASLRHRRTLGTLAAENSRARRTCVCARDAATAAGDNARRHGQLSPRKCERRGVRVRKRC